MGTLDDAIREHLELKRRAGASADEVRQLESEALGPARRDAGSADADRADTGLDAPEAEFPDEPRAATEPEDRDAAFRPVREPESLREPEELREPEPEPPREPAATAPDAGPDDAQWLDDDPFGDGGSAPAPRAAPSPDYVAPDDEGEDLLEETPDFLQETPDHDKLWFEQKPPRDFDFDN